MSNFNLGKETSIFKARSDSFPGPWAEVSTSGVTLLSPDELGGSC